MKLSHSGGQADGPVISFLASQLSMVFGFVSVANLSEALTISIICTVSGFFVQRILKRSFPDKDKKVKP